MYNLTIIILQESFRAAIVPYLGAIAVFVSLIINNYISSRFRKRDVQRNWYLKVLIEPNIKTIDKFYEDINKKFKGSITSLEKNKDITSKEFSKLKVSEIGAFQELKRAFENNFIKLISLSHRNSGKHFWDEVGKVILGEKSEEEKDISEELTFIILDLEDFYTQHLDNYSSKKESIDEFEKYLTLNKAKLIQILFRPLR